MRGPLSLAALAALSLSSAQNNRPVIGILTLPSTSHAGMNSYFPASYVKWVESAGARVVPIFYDAPLETNAALLKSLNGALFTGGGASFFTKSGELTQFAATAQLVFNESVAAASSGETWPLWGTCLGFELICTLASGPSQAILTTGWDSENYTTSVAWCVGVGWWSWKGREGGMERACRVSRRLGGVLQVDRKRCVG